MAIEITMPKLSDTMTEGLFSGWKKSVGDRIERGDIIAEVETDKAVMDLEAFASGVLLKTLVHGGENVRVGTVLGLIGEAGEMVLSAAADQSVSPVTTPGAGTQTAVVSKQEAPPVAPETATKFTEMGHEKASPLVRHLAREQGIDLERVTGSGPEGRVTQDDLEAFAGQRQGKPEPAVPSAASGTASVLLSESAAATPMRRAIAATVSESWQSIPHFSVTVEINMEECREIVRELKAGPHPVGYNALVIKACARALPDFPRLRTGDPAPATDIHINFAVAKPDGLLMPVVKGCQRLSVAEIEGECSRLAEKSRAGQLTTDEMTGGAFSVSNLGMYGVDEFNALIMPGQTGILAVGAVSERPVVQDGRLAVAATMRVTLSSDHRTVDGAYAALFLKELRTILEKPVSLLM